MIGDDDPSAYTKRQRTTEAQWQPRDEDGLSKLHREWLARPALTGNFGMEIDNMIIHRELVWTSLHYTLKAEQLQFNPSGPAVVVVLDYGGGSGGVGPAGAAATTTPTTTPIKKPPSRAHQYKAHSRPMPSPPAAHRTPAPSKKSTAAPPPAAAVARNISKPVAFAPVPAPSPSPGATWGDDENLALF